jgi:hypothetical protein
MAVNAKRMNDAFAKFSKLSYEKYRQFGAVAGFYEAMLNGLLLGYDTPERVLERIEEMVVILQAEVDQAKDS